MRRDSGEESWGRPAEPATSKVKVAPASASSRALVAWALIAACTVVLAGPVGRGWLRPGPARSVELWALDRAAHAAFAIDSDGMVVSRVSVGLEVAVPKVVAPARWLLDDWIDSFGERYVAHAADDPRWERARPGAWVLLRSPDAPRTSAASLPVGGAFLERWVRRGTPAEWTRAFRIPLEWSARAMASSEEGVWVAAERICALKFSTHAGRPLFERTLADADGVEALCVASTAAGGGVWIAAGGAVLRLDRTGRRLPGQGGFAHLVALFPGTTRTEASISRSR
ncbi:hypothetical protein Poly30_17640 [Planctomycetes bacterium Poly30]|uniref:Uncharacterized protein n=1 Tax=Saltatorellus ferox TaxID=2528018 RepID=A0A518EQ92_9BACT|nr:hypothetical protein Poly30_17640 [Planctomycetes bacterium Poly30]